MPTAVLFDEAVFNIGRGLIDLANDDFKAALANSAPSQANDDTLSDISEITAGFGYSAGGVELTGVTWAEQSSGVWKWSADDYSYDAVGGSIGPFRYIVFHSVTADKLVCYVDIGASTTLSASASFNVDIGATGIFLAGEGVVS